MIIVINIFLGVLGVYFLIGLLFGIYFLIKGAVKIDPLMAASKKKVRFLLFPGVVATWPFLISKLFNSNAI